MKCHETVTKNNNICLKNCLKHVRHKMSQNVIKMTMHKNE